MEEKKLTDEEIINALEHCTVDYPSCEGCPLYNEKNCATKAIENTIAIIHRLQAEKEELKNEYVKLDLECQKLKTENDELKSPKFANWKVKFFKAQEEIERLTEELATAKQELVNEQRYYENAYSKACQLEAKNAELQKQVDELREQLLMAKLQGLNEGYNNGVQAERNAQIFKPMIIKLPKEISEPIRHQAVKDTAKEIYDELKNEVISVDIPCGGEPAEEDCRAVLWWKIEQILRKKAQVE